MIESIISSVAAGLIMLFVGAFIGRFSVKSKTAENVDDMDRELASTKRELHEHIKVAEERNEIILESLLAILLTLKRGNANGEADGALKKLNEYLLKNSSKK